MSHHTLKIHVTPHDKRVHTFNKFQSWHSQEQISQTKSSYVMTQTRHTSITWSSTLANSRPYARLNLDDLLEALTQALLLVRLAPLQQAWGWECQPEDSTLHNASWPHPLRNKRHTAKRHRSMHRGRVARRLLRLGQVQRRQELLLQVRLQLLRFRQRLVQRSTRPIPRNNPTFQPPLAAVAAVHTRLADHRPPVVHTLPVVRTPPAAVEPHNDPAVHTAALPSAAAARPFHPAKTPHPT
mmetsp:Transcript_22623/g.48992  ORF Transcript_22623/g.48992 Transcript_22623/m.48992 type:complete len:240 (+) Transcript_22623:815-1534(+)